MTVTQLMTMAAQVTHPLLSKKATNCCAPAMPSRSNAFQMGTQVNPPSSPSPVLCARIACYPNHRQGRC